MAPTIATIDKLTTLAATEPAPLGDARELRATIPLGGRGADYLVNLELAARHDRERQVFEGVLRWRMTNRRGEGGFHSSSHPDEVVLVEVQNPRFSVIRLREVFELAAAELRRAAAERPEVFADLLDPAHDAWGRGVADPS